MVFEYIFKNSKNDNFDYIHCEMKKKIYGENDC